MQDGDGQDIRAKKPIGYVNVLYTAFKDGAEKYDSVSHPNQGDQDINRPFVFGILFGAGITQGQG